MASLYVHWTQTARQASRNFQSIVKQTGEKPFLYLPSKMSQKTGLPWARSLSVRQLHSTSSQKPVIVLASNNSLVNRDLVIRLSSSSSPSSPSDEEAERKLQSPYHFSLKDDIGDNTVHHYHPEVYPEGVSDERGQDYYKDEEEPYVDEYDEEDIKHGILEAALELVAIHGWTKSAIVAAAESYGYPGVAHGMFPGGAADLANYYYAKCNSELRAELEAESGNEIPSQTAFVRDAMFRRLKMTLKVKDSWPEAMAALASSPEGIKGALDNLSTLCDDIWHYAGDKSTDTNWYTKRALLAAVYKATEFYMMQDNSTDNQATWDFLDRRLSGAVELGTAFRQQRQSMENVVGSLFSAASTVANLMGAKK